MDREKAIRCARFVQKLPLCRVIWNDDGSPYLLRIYLLDMFRKHLDARFLHYFFRGDLDRELHNHPWDESESVILFGGYIEERQSEEGGPVVTTVYRPGDRNHLRANDYHRVDLINPEWGCLTYFRAGRRTQTWGFRHPETLAFESIAEREERMRQARR